MNLVPNFNVHHQNWLVMKRSTRWSKLSITIIMGDAVSFNTSYAGKVIQQLTTHGSLLTKSTLMIWSRVITQNMHRRRRRIKANAE